MKTFSRRGFNIFILFALIFSLVSTLGTARALAQTAGPITYTFEELGNADLVMEGPYDAKSIVFSLPVNWVLQEGTAITLFIDTTATGNASSNLSTGSGYLGGTLDVYFNGNFEKSVPLQIGQNIAYSIPLDQKSLISESRDGRMEISFFLNAVSDCLFDQHHTTIAIRSESSVSLLYAEGSVASDLRLLPWPIYQPDVNFANPALLIVPDNASAEELQAALLVMAGFGRMTQGNLTLEMLPASMITETQLAESNLIFVGKSVNLGVSKPVSWPLPFDNSAKLVSPEMQPEDGVLEIAPSPWNQAKAALLISGNTGEAVIRAAQAATTGNLQTAKNSSVSFVAQVNPVTYNVGIRPGTQTQVNGNALDTLNYSFSDLGYATASSSGIGTNYFVYEFVIPPGEVPISPTYIELSYSNSALVDTNRSGLVVNLNNQLVGSARFDAVNNSQVTTRVNVPTSVFRTGLNKMEIQAELLPTNICAVFSNSTLWLTLYEESYLHLPLRSADVDVKAIKNLKNFPVPFSNNPSLSNTLLVLPPQSAEIWPSVGKLAYDFGKSATGAVIAFDVGFDGSIPPEKYQASNLIVVGKPSDLPILQEMKTAMPASFEPGSNVAFLQNQQVIYRVADAKDLGYLELFPAPWNTQNAIMFVGGTTVDGVKMAISALLDDRLRDTLSGNFASVDATQTLVVDTRTGTGIGRLATGVGAEIVISETPTVDSASVSEASFAKTRSLILTAILVVLLVMVAIFVFAFIMSKRHKTAGKT